MCVVLTAVAPYPLCLCNAGEWAKAEELVVTAEEKEDLEYLRAREQ